jgi:CheY-like chemotaxis protein
MANAILLVEDSADDENFFRRVLQQNQVGNPLMVVRDGAEAIAYLEGLGKFADREKYPLPKVLFLDLIMPGGDGFIVLEWLAHNPSIKNEMLIFVLSQLGDSGQIRRAYDLGANSFLPKPFSPEDLKNLIRHFDQFWILQGG